MESTEPTIDLKEEAQKLKRKTDLLYNIMPQTLRESRDIMNDVKVIKRADKKITQLFLKYAESAINTKC